MLDGISWSTPFIPVSGERATRGNIGSRQRFVNVPLRPGFRRVDFENFRYCVVFDRDTVFIGSLNFGPRSEAINTETGLVIRSPDLAEDILEVVDTPKDTVFWRVRLDADGGLVWEAAAWKEWKAAVEREEPDASFWRRLLLLFLAPWISESLL